MSDWIKCSDEVPDQKTDVQVYCSDTKEQFVGFHIGNGEFQYAKYAHGAGYEIDITCRPNYWKPLGEPPID